MFSQESCQGCGQGNKCRRGFENLGRTGGPSIAFDVVLAFVVPISVFLMFLVIIDVVLPGAGDSTDRKGLWIFVGLVLAVCLTVVCVLAVKLVSEKLRRGRR